MKYSVWVAEVWYQRVDIEAENREEAIKLVQQGDGDYEDDDFDYSHTVDDGWRIEEWITE